MLELFDLKHFIELSIFTVISLFLAVAGGVIIAKSKDTFQAIAGAILSIVESIAAIWPWRRK